MPSGRAPVTAAPIASRAAPRPSLASVQCLRGVAALLVVMFHMQGAAAIKMPGESRINDLFALRQLGSIGVDIFFVISGFIMVHVSHDRFGRRGAAVDFLVRRAIRIVPLYWLVTTFMVLLLYFTPHAFDTLRFRLGHTIDSYLFLPTTSSAGEMVPVLGVGWTLTYEVVFYVLFALLLSTSLRASLVVTAVLFTAAAVAGYLLRPTGPFGATLTSDLFLEFFVGECVALWLLRREAPGVRVSRLLLVLAACAFVGHVFFGDLRALPVVTVALPTAALLLALVSLERRGAIRFPRWLATTGDESYSLYLCHMVSGAVFFKLCIALRLSQLVPVDLLVVLAVVNAVAWGRCLHRVVERPLTRLLNRAWQRADAYG